jgi:hypothetical protein
MSNNNSNDIIAIDIAILPSMNITKVCKEINSFISKYDKNTCILDNTHIPHCTLIQSYIYRTSIPMLINSINALINSTEAFNVSITRFDGNRKFEVDKQQPLITLHYNIVQIIEEYTIHIEKLDENISAAFYTEARDSKVDSEIAESTKQYVNNFIQQHSKKHYKPHITLASYDIHEQCLSGIKEEFGANYEKLNSALEAFEVCSVLLFQLGNHGCCRKLIHTFNFKSNQTHNI